MSRKPFDREIINVRERPLSSDHNEQRSDVDASIIETMYRQLQSRTFAPAAVVEQPDAGVAPPTGFLSDGFKVRPGGGLAVQLTAGLGFWSDPTQAIDIGSPICLAVNDLGEVKPLVLTAPELVAVPANASGNPRIDIIEVRLDRRLTDTDSRDIMSALGVFDPTAVTKTLTYSLDGESTINGAGGINLKTGVPAGVPVAPATDAGYVKIAEILVPNASGAVAENQIKDLRHMLGTGGTLRIAAVVRLVIAGGGATVTPSIRRASTPPGLTMWVTAGGGNNATFLALNVVAGDVNDFDGAGNGAAICHCSGVFDAGDGVLIQPFGGLPVLLTVDAGIQTAAAAAIPPQPVAVGQQEIEFVINLRGLDSTTGANVILPDGTFDFPVLIELGR